MDQDRWFKNVEVVALRTISPEPVQYVASIHRYYLLFEKYFESIEKTEFLKKNFCGTDL